jgi:palmitoyltransferase
LFTFGMTVTSIDLAMDNYTQVEKIGAKYAVHILAVLKPPRIEMVRSDAAVPQYYKEITYPLDAGMPPSSDYYQPADMPRTKIFSHARLSEPIAHPPLPTSEDISKSSAAPMQGAEGSYPNRDSSKTNEIPAAADPMQESLDESSGMGLENGTSMQEVPRPAVSTAESTVRTGDRQNATARERLSERDLQATRTFAILQMLQTGENPWDLGSRILNFKTVMGSNLLDWFLPIQRSPCCSHEDGESQFALGPAVELLKSSVGFIPLREPGTLHRRRRKRTHRRTRSEDAPDLDVKISDSNVIATQPNPSIPLQDFNDSSTSSRPA